MGSKLKYVTLNFTVAVILTSFLPAMQHGFHVCISNTHVGDLIQAWVYKVTPYKEYQRKESVANLNYSILVIGIFFIGGMVGSFFTFLVADKYGRRFGLIVNSGLTVFSHLVMCAATYTKIYAFLVIGRFMFGINSGLNLTLSQMYVMEISPPSIRGSAGTVFYMGYLTGICISTVLGSKEVLGTNQNWRWTFAVCLIPTFIQLTFLPHCPESPRFILFKYKDIRAAMESLEWFRGSSNISEELETLEQEYYLQENYPKIKVTVLLNGKTVRGVTLLVILMQISHETSGLDTVVLYTNDIFVDLGMSFKILNVSVLVVCCLASLIPFILVDIVGRKKLLFIGSAFLALTCILLTIFMSTLVDWEQKKYVAIGLVYTMTAAYSIGIGPAPSFYGAEIFPYKLRCYGLSLCTPITWMADFIFNNMLDYTRTNLGFHIFLIYGMVNILAAVYLWVFFIETKGLTEAQIAARYEIKDDSS